MASPVKMYQREMHDNLGFFPTWFPADPIEIGDAGVFEGGRFRRMASLVELGIGCKVEAGAATQNVQYTSTQGTKVATTSGAAAAVAKAEITIEFSREGAFVFHVSHLRPQQLKNRVEVSEEIVKAYNKGDWNKEWFVVEALHSAERSTIIVSEDTSAGLVLMARADAPIVSISLADPKVSLTVVSTRGKVVHIIGGKGLHPLYSCMRLNDPLIGKPSMQPVRGSCGFGNEIPFIRPGIDELLDS
jgi:hypothetical protein